MSSPTPKLVTIPVNAKPFEDIIDGYFPLQESLRQMLVRNGFASACVTLTHAPIMNIPGLAPDAPVPLRLDRGTAGIADRLDIIIAMRGGDPQLSGSGKWRWDSQSGVNAPTLSPLTRLAEPAIVKGIGIVSGTTETQDFGQVSVLEKSEFVVLQGRGTDMQASPNTTVWMRSPDSGRIHLHGSGGALTEIFDTPECVFDQRLRQHHLSKPHMDHNLEILMRVPVR